MRSFGKVLGISVMSAAVGAAAYAVAEQVARMRGYSLPSEDTCGPCAAEKVKCRYSHGPCGYKRGKENDECGYGMSVCPYAEQVGGCHQKNGPMHGPYTCPACCPDPESCQITGKGSRMRWCIHTAEGKLGYCPFNMTSGCPHLDGAVEGRVCPWAWEEECIGAKTTSNEDDFDFGGQYDGDEDDCFGDEDDPYVEDEPYFGDEDDDEEPYDDSGDPDDSDDSDDYEDYDEYLDEADGTEEDDSEDDSEFYMTPGDNSAVDDGSSDEEDTHAEE